MKTFVLVLATLWSGAILASADPLPSWNDGGSKKAVVEFVEKVTQEGAPGFVPPPERIAVFDNDGTLWSEQPVYFQAAYLLDTIRAKAKDHPEWKEREPFASVLKGDFKKVAASGEAGLGELFAVTHAGMSTEEFGRSVSEWIATARHPNGKLYTEMTFQPMLELLDYLRANGFKTYIVSGGGTEFLRQWSEKAYGIPPEQVIGTYGKMKYELIDGKGSIRKLPELALVNDKENKPVGIQTFIGRRPIAAFGNSDGDFQMLEWTTQGEGPRLGMIIHHDDEKREWAYDRESHIGRLAKGLDAAKENGWIITSMKNDWKVIHPNPK